jgi:alkylation response protein AidB-like acyl-CoA dehydrogenase
MDFDFTEEQLALCRAVQRWVDKGYPFARRRRIVEAGGFSREAWNDLAELGLLGLLVPPAHGGLGMGPVESMLVMEELGRGLVVEPYAEGALVSASLLAEASPEVQAAWLPHLADGSALLVPAVLEHGARHPLQRIECQASPSDAGWLLSGEKQLVAAGDHADGFVVAARCGDDADASNVGLFLVERRSGGVTTRGHRTQDGARAAQLSLRRAHAALIVPPPKASAVLERAVDVAIAALAAEAVGAMDQLVAMTAAYMGVRRQFGVPIATFQALRHRIADTKMQLELARSMSYLASLRLSAPPPLQRRAISQAKVQLGESMRFVGQQCIQLHGAIGVTDECPASHYFKRLTCIELAYGDTMYHLSEVSARMLDTAGVFE